MVLAGSARIALGDFFGKYTGKPAAYRTFSEDSGKANGAQKRNIISQTSF
jgi:hypothetical protein